MIDVDTLLTWGAAFKQVKENQMVFMEEAECRFYYQLVSGKVRWVNINDEGKEFLQGIIHPGESFGELPLFDDEKYAASAIADIDSVIIRLHKPTFLQLLKENSDLHFSFSRLLAERLRFKFFIVKEMAAHNPEHSITMLFNYFKESKKNICTDCNRVNLTRQQIADMTGMRVETVIRTIRSLQEKGQLVIERGKVYC